MKNYHIKGITNYEAICDKCGAALKQAIILASMDLNGNPQGHLSYFGADCAAQLTRLSQSTLRSRARAAEEVRQAEEHTARVLEARRKLVEQREREWLQDTYGVEDMDAAAKKSGKEWLTVFNEFFAWLDQADRA
ncbi:hypothetical protein ACG5V6_04940 [Streptomyces chitinivorans]|uniref:Uncharacterized protein n=1 Tax=Streptomyces chitinivorans TaxID=1257027 RepID=A0ABW7HNW8_9ACTN|nr:hypothetical protein [Streptomyces chitinivorans]MDH2408306.1 hypothetical protein [Streptomyces chitinivorans]